MTKIDYMNDLRVEVQTATPGLQNLIKNPSGEQGAWGWETPVANTTMYSGNDLEYFPTTGGFYMTFKTTVSQAAYFRSELLPISAGQYAVGRFTQWGWGVAGTNHRVRFEWYNSQKVYLSSSTQTAAISATGEYFVPAAQAPTNTAYMKIRFDMYGTSGANPAAGAYVEIKNVMVATSSSSTGFGSVQTNYITNPNPASGNTNTWTGWTTQNIPVDIGYSASVGGRPAFFVRDSVADNLGTQTNGMQTGLIPISPGTYHSYTADFYPTAAGLLARIFLKYYDADGVETHSGWYVPASMDNAPANTWTTIQGVSSSPSNAAYVKVIPHLTTNGRLWYGNETHYIGKVFMTDGYQQYDYFDGSTADTATVDYAWSGTPYASTSTATIASAGFAYNEPYAWQAITGSVTNLDIQREAMNVGMLGVTIRDKTLDPSVYASPLKVGRQMRVRVNDGGTWKNIFTGKINNAHVDYEKQKKAGALLESTITISAIDGLSDLANNAEGRSVVDTDELPYILEGKGIPWNVNGMTSHYTGTPSIPVYNDNLSAADQVVITRDTNRAQAWIDKDGILQVWDTQSNETAKFVFADYIDDGTTNYDPWNGFESNIAGIVGYTGSSAVSRAAAAARSGSYGLRVTVTDGTNGYCGWYTNPDVVMPGPGGYRVSFWVRSSIANAKMEMYDPDYTYWTLPATPNTWMQVTTDGWAYKNSTTGNYEMEFDFSGYGADWNDPPTGATFDFDDFVVTRLPNDMGFVDIDVDYDTDRIVNHVIVKHLTTNADGAAEEVTYGPYESATSVVTYGPRKAEYTYVGDSSGIASYASNILNSNANPVRKVNSIRLAIKDTSDLYVAADIDLRDFVNVVFDDKFDNHYRINKLTHSMDANGWYIDVEFDVYYRNAMPQYTPAPPVALPSASSPLGEIIMYAGSDTPYGWLKCEGQSVPVASYPDLHAAIGYTYGGSGANFNVPNFKARSPIGVGGTADSGSIGNSYALGQKYGHEAMQAHSHGLPAHVFNWGQGGLPSSVYIQNAIAAAGNPPSNNLVTSQGNWSGTHTAGSGNTQNVHPVIGMNFLIRALK